MRIARTRRRGGRPFVVGAAQAIALIPGFSRSGATMGGGLLVGLSHKDAARFAFLLATPIIGAAALLKLPGALRLAPATACAGRRSSARSAAAVTAYLAVKFLMRFFETRTLTPVRDLLLRGRARLHDLLRRLTVPGARSAFRCRFGECRYVRLVDWRIYHAVNTFVSHHSWIGSSFRVIETYGTILIGVAAFALWLLARPGGDRKWKLVSGSALGAAALGFDRPPVIASIWHRDRPYQTHHVAHIWGPAHDRRLVPERPRVCVVRASPSPWRSSTRSRARSSWCSRY